MGNSPELSMPNVNGQLGGQRRGIALPSALFGLVAIGVMALGIYSMSDLQAKSVKNRESSSRAMMVAEAGMVHALTVLRDSLKMVGEKELIAGYDTEYGNADDGLIVGYNLSAAAQIPASGKVVTHGNYKVVITDDPGDTDGNPESDDNFRVLVSCTGETPDGGKASISAVVGSALFPGVVTEGNLTINGDPQIVGKCGGAHANAIAIISGHPTVTNTLSATGAVQGSGTVEDTLGNPITPLQYQPPLDIPEVLPSDYCGTADYTLNSNGTVFQKSTGLSFNINSVPKFGWKRSSSSPVVFDHDGSSLYPGTVCAQGNVQVGGNPGAPSNPLAMSIIATGSITIAGNPFLTPSSPDAIMFLAGGDVMISGNPDAGAFNYEGLIYATSQCKVNGNPDIFGQMVCKNKPQPAGTINLTDLNQISGNPKITYDCGGFRLNRRKFLSWYQTGTQ